MEQMPKGMSGRQGEFRYRRTFCFFESISVLLLLLFGFFFFLLLSYFLTIFNI